jgi:hypothetical protein
LVTMPDNIIVRLLVHGVVANLVNCISNTFQTLGDSSIRSSITVITVENSVRNYK